MQKEVTLVNECDVYSASTGGILKSRLWLVPASTGDNAMDYYRDISIELAYTENQAEISKTADLIERVLRHLGYNVNREYSGND